MSEHFPDIDIEALKKFAAAAAAAEHAYRISRNAPLAKTAGTTSRSAKGKARVADKATIYPRVTKCTDVVWVGEWMIQIDIDPASAPLGPHQMMAHFPYGRIGYTTKAMVGMTQIAREHAQISAPKIYGYYDNEVNPVKAEVVLMEYIHGDTLEQAWHTLSPAQLDIVCDRLAELLIKLFSCRGPDISTYTNVRDSPPRSATESAQFRAPVLLAPPFDDGPLLDLQPQEALTSAHDYLIALSQRVDRVFSDERSAAAARSTGWPRTPPLSDRDVLLARDTWTRLGSLVLYHSGGYYVPPHLSAPARQLAFGVLQAKEFGLIHSDLRMSRIIIKWEAGGTDARLVVTGWEYAHRAPLWSCARMPLWLLNSPGPEPLSWEDQRAARSRVFAAVLHSPLPRAWEWVVAHVFGATERWFEGVLSAGWGFRDTAEVCLARLEEHWAREGPGVAFPLEAGGSYLHARMFSQPPIDVDAAVVAPGPGPGPAVGPGSAWEDELQATDPEVLEAAMESWKAFDAAAAARGEDGDGGEVPLERTRQFVEEVRVAMNALAIGGGSSNANQQLLSAWPDPMNQVD